MVDIEIENIIAYANLDIELDLEEVSGKLEGSEFNPERFPGVIYKNEDPNVVVLVFKTGKMMCTAAKSFDDVKQVMNKVEDILKNAGLLDKVEKPEEEQEQSENGEAGNDDVETEESGKVEE